MFKRILFATDFSEKSMNIIKRLPEFKKIGVEEVIILRVINLTRILGVARGIDIESYIKAMEEETVSKLKGIAKEIEEMGFKAKTLVPPAGDPVNEIIKASESHDVDLIVMGSRGRSTLKAILLGSTAEGVVRRANVPVLVFKNNVKSLFRRILYAHDLSEVSQRVMKYVKFIAKSVDSEVLLVHVLEKGEVVDEEPLKKVENELKDAGVNVKILIGQGSPHKEIVSIAEMEKSSVIFMGTSGAGLKEILGSTADFVIRHSKIPVFVSRV